MIDEPVITNYNVPSDIEQDSIVEEAPTVNSDSESETDDWEVIEKGTEKVKPKLVNKTGYSNVVSRVRNDTRYRACSVKTKSNKCPAAVRESRCFYNFPNYPEPSARCRGPHSDKTENRIQRKDTD